MSCGQRGKETPAGGSGSAAEIPGEQASEAKAEEVVWQGRPSLKSLATQFLLSALAFLTIVVRVAYFARELEEHAKAKRVLWIEALILLVVIAIYNLYKVIKLKATLRYRLTTERILVERGILGKHSGEVELVRVRDVSVRQKLSQRIFGVGTVQVIPTDASVPVLDVAGIANPIEVKGLIREHTMRIRKDKDMVMTNLQ